MAQKNSPTVPRLIGITACCGLPLLLAVIMVFVFVIGARFHRGAVSVTAQSPNTIHTSDTTSPGPRISHRVLSDPGKSGQGTVEQRRTQNGQ